MMRHLLGRVRTKAEETKKQQDNATGDLEKELVLGILQRLHDEAHAQSHNQRIDDVAHRRPNTSHKTIPATFVQSALDAEDSDGAHGC